MEPPCYCGHVLGEHNLESGGACNIEGCVCVAYENGEMEG